ncbi:MAG: alpha-hydroxy-acid oxidizing protein [Oscillospiraceae bacterium]|nr:alpha-hydroxy-acid oxidizing protein [Oscillospiraceae bacterium]
MTYEEALRAARGNMGKCHACPVCNGLACKNTIPGPGAKGTGTVAARNYDAWQNIYLNMDTIAPNLGVDTAFELFGERFDLPVFTAPIGAVTNHYGSKYDEYTYDALIACGAREAGIAAFTGDGLNEMFFEAGCTAMEKAGFAVPTVKPWHRDLVFKKIDYAKSKGAKWIAMDIDASGLPFLKSMTPPSGPKTVEELREFADYAGMPFILKGIMTPAGAEKAIAAGASAIVVSNHGGRVLDHTPATARVLRAIAETVDGRIPIFVDGGIRTGYDVFKALALGADAVLIGRPFVCAVYGGGAEGVRAYADKLRSELRDAMEMTGCATLADITYDRICHE